MTGRPLRPHQVDAKAKLRAALLAGKRRVMLALPTGAGKTRLAAEIINGVLAHNRRVVFTVPAVSLVDQTVDEFAREGVRDIGVMQADHPLRRPMAPVQVASVQTLARRTLPWEPDLVIVDEAHRQFEGLTSWLAGLACPAIGLSATPWSRGLGRTWDELIVATTTAELIDAGYLSPFKVFASGKPDLHGVRTTAGDWNEGDLGRAVNKPKLVADIVTTWLERAEGRPTLVFCVDRAHAAAVQKQFEVAGVRCGYVDCNTDREEREQVRRRFASGETPVVANVGVLTTGVDWDVRCLILARPTKSEILYTQIIGRALRTAPGKESALILDHSDTTMRMGFVTDIQHGDLCDGNPDKSATRAHPERVAECSQCSFVRPSGALECPSCGFKAERRSEVEIIDGRLVEVSATTAHAVPTCIQCGGPRSEFAAKKCQTCYRAKSFYRELKGHVAAKGWKPGAAAMLFKEKFGEFPDRRWEKEGALPPVSPEVLGWLKSRQIAWAKRRQAA